MKKQLLVPILTLLGFITSMQAQLTKGDIVIIGMSTATQYDEFSWIPLVDIPEGTKIYFTDAGYDRTNNRFLGINPVTGNPIATEGLYRYTAPTGGLARGTVVTFTENNSPAQYTALNASGTKFGSDTALTIGNSGEQITVFQSTDTDTASTFGTTNITIIYMATLSTTDFSTYVYNAAAQVEFDKATNLHSQLDHVNGTSDAYIATGIASGWIDESDNARYEGSPLTGTKAQILTLVSTLSNWRRYNNPSPDGAPYQSAIPITAGWTTNGITNISVTVPDTTPPTVAITSTANASTNSNSIPVTITFNESVTGFTSGDVTVGNGTLSNFSGSGTTYTATITPTAEGTVTVNVDAGVAVDAASNPNTAATQLSRIYDITRPTATITTTTTSPTNTTGIIFTITFSEPVTGFSLIDNVPSNATIYAFSGSGTTYTLKMDPASNGTSSLGISANGCIDAAGNTNTAVGAYSIVYDTVQPTVSITSTASNPTSATPFPVTITFSEAVTGFDISDITVTNATLSDFSAVSGSVYTVSVTGSVSNTISISVDAAKATDTANNGNTASNTFNINYTTPCSSNRIWIGTWIGGLPVADQPVIFLVDYTATSNLAACSMEVSNGATVTFPSGYNLTISGNILTSSGGKLVMGNNANLIQAGEVNNNVGTDVTIKRNASLRYLDYVYWSSPVENQNLLAFSPETLPGRFYTIDEPTNAFVPATPATNSFSLAKGYLIRAYNTYQTAPTTQQTFAGSFTGRPNNGDITIPVTALGGGFNLIGNPYPSTVNADLFLADPANQNIQTLYFWTHLTSVAGGTNYATYNATGAAGAAPSDTDPVSETPNGFIQVGQGFIAEVSNAGNATFKNSMRAANNSNQFFRTADTAEKNRIWLNLSDANNGYNQALIGYVAGATNALDSKFDGKLIESTGTRLYNVISDNPYTIQGRALPFENTDTVAMGFMAAAAGTYTISIDHVDGLFSTDQDIFLKDNLTGSINNLKSGAYTFASQEGTFNGRFEVVYQNTTLGIETPSLTAESIVVYKQNNTLNINAGTTVMAGVKIFDIRGRLIFERNGINATTTAISDLGAAQQVLVIQITSVDNKTVSKKVVY